jgi:hypothetical protein
MLNEFQVVLSTDKSLRPKHLPHYIRWVKDCYSFLRLPPTERLSYEQTRLFLSNLEKSCEPWQVKQAEQALRRFDFFHSRPSLLNLRHCRSSGIKKGRSFSGSGP